MDDIDSNEPEETIEQLRTSFSYGSRSNLNVKFFRDLTDAEFGDFLEELFDATSDAIDTGDATSTVDVLYRWQVHAYGSHLGDPADFRHRYDDVPLTPMGKPLAESRVVLLTSSGHFVDGDDPMPFGVPDMTQREAESRIGEFLREAPTLSSIPVVTPPAQLRVRHGGYPVQAAQADHQVALPLDHLRDLASEGVIGELSEDAFSFVGATAQGRLRNAVAPEWADMLRDLDADAALLVPV